MKIGEHRDENRENAELCDQPLCWKDVQFLKRREEDMMKFCDWRSEKGCTHDRARQELSNDFGIIFRPCPLFSQYLFHIRS